MFGKDLWNLGQFTLNQVEQTYSTMAGFCPKIHISTETDEFFSKTQRVEKTFINIDRTMILGNATVHCRISYYPDTKRHFDRLVIFDDQIKAYYYGNDHPEIIKLPQTSQEFGTFVASGGRVDVDDYPEKKFLDCKIGGGWGFKAEGKQVFVEGHGKRKCVLQFEKEIDAIFAHMIVFNDGTVETLSPTLYARDYIGQMKQQMRDEFNQSVEIYRTEVKNIDQTLLTPDGVSVKKLLADIGDYIFSNQDHNDMKILLEQKQTFDTLTKMIQLSKDPENRSQIQKMMTDIQYKVSVGKDIVCGVLSIVAAGILIGLGALCVSIFAVMTYAATAGPGALMFMGAAGLMWPAIVNLHSARKGIEYNNNVKKVTDFFASTPGTAKESSGANDFYVPLVKDSTLTQPVFGAVTVK